MPSNPPSPSPDPGTDFTPEHFNPEALDPSLGAETGSLPQAPLFSFGAKLFALILFGVFFFAGELFHTGPKAAGPFDAQLLALYVIALLVILWADGVFDRR